MRDELSRYWRPYLATVVTAVLLVMGLVVASSERPDKRIVTAATAPVPAPPPVAAVDVRGASPESAYDVADQKAVERLANGRKRATGGQEPAEEQKSAEMTSGQENALRAGQNYIDSMSFSKAGLIQQLSSSAGDGYSKADATFAANNVEANWNKEAVEAAQGYLDTMPFSKDDLVQQLSSAAGDEYTRAQADYALNKVYE